jgi:hypothetical protein
LARSSAGVHFTKHDVGASVAVQVSGGNWHSDVASEIGSPKYRQQSVLAGIGGIKGKLDLRTL